MLKFIVAGTGRSGTVYMARVLTSLGLPCGHESIFNQEKESVVLGRFYGTVPPTISKCSENYGWLDMSKVVADSSYMVVPYLDYADINKVPILHVVRNPLAVISSFVKDLKYFTDSSDKTFNEKGWEEWIYSHVPELNLSMNPIERACIYYTVWNQKIEDTRANRPYLFHRAEDTFKKDFFDFLRIEEQPVPFKNKRTNTMKQRTEDFKEEDIPNGKIKDAFLDMMQRYGYVTRPVF